jgi:hypothetical protein
VASVILDWVRLHSNKDKSWQSLCIDRCNADF